MKCQDCDYTNGKSMFVRRHSHTVHGKFRPGTNILCDYCGTFFYSYSLFRLHKEKYHFGIEEARNCICDECGKAFRTKQKLMMHKHRAHQHVSMRTCHVCDIVYPNAAKAYKHYQLFWAQCFARCETQVGKRAMHKYWRTLELPG